MNYKMIYCRDESERRILNNGKFNGLQIGGIISNIPYGVSGYEASKYLQLMEILEQIGRDRHTNLSMMIKDPPVLLE